MKILYITPYYKPSWYYGGPPGCIAEQAEYLVKHHDLHIEVLSLNINGTERLFDTDDTVVKVVGGVKVHYLPPSKNKFGRAYFSSPLLKKYIVAFSGFDLVHVNTLFNAFSRTGMQFAHKNHIPYVVTPHGMLDAFSLTRSKWMKKLHRFLFDDDLLAASNVVQFTTANEEKNSIIIKKIKPIVIPLGFEFPDGEIPVKKTNTQNALRLVFLGRINRKKGIDLLVQALSTLDRLIVQNIQVDIFGDDDDNCKSDLEQLITSLNLQNNFSFLGTLPPAKRDETLRSYDALVLTSHQENFGLVVTEALSNGLPVFVSDKVNLCDFVIENNGGWVTSLEVNKIAKNLKEIYLTPSHTRNEKGVNGYKAVRANFSMKNIAVQYVELYKKFIATKRL